jgi:hypothetical protein
LESKDLLWVAKLDALSVGLWAVLKVLQKDVKMVALLVYRLVGKLGYSRVEKSVSTKAAVMADRLVATTVDLLDMKLVVVMVDSMDDLLE